MMPQIVRGLLWAIAILIIAWAGSRGAVSRDTACWMVIVMPVLAVLHLGLRNRSCRRADREARP
jgi:hypothetical protein